MDGSGNLDRMEMYSILREVGTDKLGLDQRQIAAVVAAADEDGDGVVDYGRAVQVEPG